MELARPADILRTTGCEPGESMKIRRKLLAAASAMALPLAALADGDVIFDFNANGLEWGVGLAEGPSGRLYFTMRAFDSTGSISSERNYLIGVESGGQPITTFGTNGRILTATEAGSVVVRPNGTVLTGRFRIYSFDVAGTLLNTAAPVCVDCIESFVAIPDGRVYFGGAQMTSVSHRTDRWLLGRVTSGGALDTAFGVDGLALKDGAPSPQISTLKSLPDGKIVAYGGIGDFGGNITTVGRFNADGSTDFTFGPNGTGVVALGLPGRTGTWPYRARAELAVDQSLRMLVPGGGNILRRLSPDGSVDNTYTGVPVQSGTSYFGFVLDSQGRAIVYGQRGDQAYVARLLPDGGFDNSFGVSGETSPAPNIPSISAVRLAQVIVDPANRPVLLMDVRHEGRSDLVLFRLTTAGALDTNFGAGVVDDDPYPDAFTIPGKTAPFNTSSVISDPITLSGFNVPTSLNITASSTNDTGVSVGCTGEYLTAATSVTPGQQVCVRLAAPPTAGASFSTTLNIGTQQATFTVTANATPADITPDPFSFVDQAGLFRNAAVQSAPVTITGITGFAPIAVDGGAYAIHCQPPYRTTASVIANGQQVCLVTQAPSTYGTSTSVTLSVNGVTDTFTASTEPMDSTPNAFSFMSQSGRVPGTVAQSHAVSITGFNTPPAISVTNGEYSIGCDSNFTAQAGVVNEPALVCVRHTVGTGTTVTTLNVGGATATFTSTAASSGSSSSGSGGGGGGALGFGEIALLGLLAVLRALGVRRRPAT